MSLYVNGGPINFIDPMGLHRNKPDEGMGGDIIAHLLGEARRIYDDWGSPFVSSPGSGNAALFELPMPETVEPRETESGDFHYLFMDFAFCGADSLFSQFSKPDSSAPGAPVATPGTTPDLVLTGGNPIAQIVDPVARAITNVTQDGHRYHSGTVDIRIIPTWYGSSVSIEGRGTGPHYWENRLLGAALVSALAAKATIFCTFGAN